ncbi:uncharacterized protein EKO05_0009962 [Ascochyta rabiei]|uniref:uncharacterized protein n=1 Tax=Didymella rabiei TaxID=5454 RepID=UPI0022015EB6|nr:uncharacterized protein EKO05_0009962 [Ascochyta rabiei]UPX19708.1 hypothetical protein EKO05_0009962 [Ascochyta rabiei]
MVGIIAQPWFSSHASACRSASALVAIYRSRVAIWSLCVCEGVRGHLVWRRGRYAKHATLRGHARTARARN